jgi:hypothetical protein
MQYTDACGEITCPRQRFRANGQTVHLHSGSLRERRLDSSGAANCV